MIAALIAALAAAVLACAQVLLSEATGLTTLGVPLEAGAERVQGVQITLIIWYCAASAPIAAWIAHRDWPTNLPGRIATAVAASSATLLTLPIVRWRAVEQLRDEVTAAVVVGALLGLAVAWWPRAGAGVAPHLTLLWVLALCLSPLPDTVFYAGLVEPLGVEPLRGLRGPIGRIPLLGEYDYHLPSMLPGIVLVLVLCGLLARRAYRRTGSRLAAITTAAAGPIVAAAAYRVAPGQLYLWNLSAAVIALGTAVLGLLVATSVAAIVARRRVARRRSSRTAREVREAAG